MIESLINMKNQKEKMYIVRSRIKAVSLMEARKIAMKQEPDEIWIDPEWELGKNKNLASAIGFTVYHE